MVPATYSTETVLPAPIAVASVKVMIFEAAVTATAVTAIGTPPFKTVNALFGGV